MYLIIYYVKLGFRAKSAKVSQNIVSLIRKYHMKKLNLWLLPWDFCIIDLLIVNVRGISKKKFVKVNVFD